jgi:hypothetical protein
MIAISDAVGRSAEGLKPPERLAFSVRGPFQSLASPEHKEARVILIEIHNLQKMRFTAFALRPSKTFSCFL